MTEEIRVIKDISIYYFEAIANLTLQKFNTLVCRMQKYSDEYGSYTAEQYYHLLARGPLCDQFMKTFLQVI